MHFDDAQFARNADHIVWQIYKSSFVWTNGDAKCILAVIALYAVISARSQSHGEFKRPTHVDIF